MASTYSSNLAIELIGTGDQAGSWGNTTNTNLGTLIEQAISGYVTQAVSTGTDTTITIPNGATGVARNMYIELTGTGGASTNLIVPANKKLYFIFNNTSSGQVTVKVSGQTGVSVPNKAKMVLVSNGTDIVDATNYVGNLSAASANITVLTSASATITNLLATSLTVSGNTFLATSSGNVGIGTSSPSEKLQINDGLLRFLRSGQRQYNIGVPSGAPDFAIDDATFSVRRFTITGSGDVGIGTSSPGYKLEVVAPSGDNITALFRSGDATAANNAGGGFRSISSATAASRLAQVWLDADGANLSGGDYFFIQKNGNSGTADIVQFSNAAMTFATNNTTRMTLDASGNLGLGVTPSAWVEGTGLNVGSGRGGSIFTETVNYGFTTFNANAYYSATNTWKYVTSNAASRYQQLNGVHSWYNAASGTAGNTITFTQAMTLDASGNLGVGTTSPGSRLHISQSGVVSFYIASTSATDQENQIVSFYNSGAAYGTLNYDGALHKFKTSGTERARITSGGNFGVGTTSPDIYSIGTYKFLTVSDSATNGYGIFTAAGGSGGGGEIDFGNQTVKHAAIASLNGSILGFFTNGSNSGASVTERARITSDGIVCIGQTSSNIANTGISLCGDGSGVNGRGRFCTDNTEVIEVNRKTSDGGLVLFYQDTVQEGSISVAGNTVSYNAFAGSHWSQLQDGSKPDILRGTVMESINELCVWPGEQNERLPKSKISDTAGSKKVYGVFMAWDNDWTATNDMLVTSVGAFICRVNGSVTVQEGDLLESNGDGTARVQADDIIRSSTIGKVTSTVKTHQYDDGSYCVPTVLYCG